MSETNRLTTTIRLPSRLLEDLAFLAKNEGRSRSNLIDLILQEGVRIRLRGTARAKRAPVEVAEPVAGSPSADDLASPAAPGVEPSSEAAGEGSFDPLF